ncbi:hypothetical protein [Aliamphritea spongicola]|nr:hypothetical protein [Aliamphritea spongicola]
MSFDTPVTGRYKVTVWHPQLLADENREAQIVDVQNAVQVTAQLTSRMDEAPAQESDDDFDFLSEY